MTANQAVLRNTLSVVAPSLGLASLGSIVGDWATIAGGLAGFAVGLVFVFVVWPRYWK